jgi:hypothetical protein
MTDKRPVFSTRLSTGAALKGILTAFISDQYVISLAEYFSLFKAFPIELFLLSSPNYIQVSLILS